ncbi:MAG: signal peptidase I [Pseudomonadota bacterium]|nr:signal peptidase I [Pseudomonadota bacterium]
MNEPSADPPEKKSELGSTLRSLAIFAVAAWALRSLVVAPFSIPSGSMLPAMYIGDYLFVHKWPYGYSRFSFPLQIPSFEGRIFSDLPERGDIVVFRQPGQEDNDFIKRVIGLPGDTVAVQGGTVILNGRPLQRQSEGMVQVPISANSPCRVVDGAVPMVRDAAGGGRTCLYPAYRETLTEGPSYLTIDQVDTPRSDDVAPTAIPAGHLFLMGDNRDDSLDSRYSPYEGGVGLVPLENLVGRASARFWSTDGSAEWSKPWTWFSALRGERIGGFTSP